MPSAIGLTDEDWMRHALSLARKGVGFTSPNPCVGALLVRDGRMLASGWHRKAGGPHAEIEAIEKALRLGHSPRGATLYVTLEPCTTHGRTPPCSEAIVRHGIKRVVVAATDTNPAHAGRAFKWLSRRGVSVAHGVLEKEARAINFPFERWITTGRPWVVAKIAMSLDGKIAAHPSESRWLTGEDSLRKAHGLRLAADAIIVGAETVRRDNPSLTVRLGARSRSKLQPWRVVLTKSGSLPEDAAIFTDEFQERTIVAKGRSLRQTLAMLGKKSVTSVLIEGGGQILAAAFKERVVDEIAFFVAPRVLGGPSQAVALGDFLSPSCRLQNLTCQKMKNDIFLHAYVHRTG